MVHYKTEQLEQMAAQIAICETTAQRISLEQDCVQHVNVIMLFNSDLSMYVTPTVSDWCVDGSTIATYVNGNKTAR